MVSLKTVLNIVCNIHNINCNAMDSFGSVCVCECLCGGERESHRTDLDHFSPFTQILALPIALASSVASSKQASPFSAHTKPKKKKLNYSGEAMWTTALSTSPMPMHSPTIAAIFQTLQNLERPQ